MTHAEGPPRPPRRLPTGWLGTSPAGPALVLAVASASAWLLYSHTLGYGFHYDDYAFARPYPLEEVTAAFTGTWDRSGIMVPFYRPLTVALYAARFELFGLDAEAHHVVSLVMFATAAWLAGLFAYRAGGSAVVGMAAAVSFVVHPAMPYAQAVWITNQMHLATSLVVLSALVWWQWVAATRTLRWWLPLIGFAVAAFLFKEDGIMLLPFIVVLHWLRRWIADPELPPVPWPMLALALAVPAALIALRSELLGGLGGYGRPTFELAWNNFTLGLNRVFRLLPAHRPWQLAASWYVTLLPMAALVALPWATRGARFLFAGGAAMGLAFNLPFVFVTKNEQMHLVAAGAALMLAGAATVLLQALRPRLVRIAASLAIAVGMAACAAVAHHISTDFAPFGRIVLSYDAIVRGWATVPQELRDYLARKAEPGAASRLSANPAEAIEFVAYGLHPVETSAEGLRYQWMAGRRVDILASAAARAIIIPLRHEAGAFQEATTATVMLEGRVVDVLHMADAEWRASSFALAREAAPAAGPMRRITLVIPRAWMPAERIPGSTDGRVLGLQVGAVEIR